MFTFLHDPNDDLDYAVPFTLEAGDAITAATAVCADADLSVHDVTTANPVIFWAAGGVDGGVYDVVVHVTTTQGRQVDQTVRLRCVQK